MATLVEGEGYHHEPGPVWEHRGLRLCVETGFERFPRTIQEVDMGRRGPQPKSPDLRVLHGDRQDRLPDPPVPSEREVLPPAGMSKDALAVWEELVPELVRLGIVAAIHASALRVLCDAVAIHAKASGHVARRGVIVTGDKGRKVKNPALQVMRDQASVIKSFATEFGLTPLALQQLRTSRGSTRVGAERLLS